MKYVNAGLGLLFFGLGALGAFLPVLPTTPFLLLASFFFLRSSQRLNDWFRSTGLFKRYLANYMDNRRMTLRGKILTAAPGIIVMSIVAIVFDNWIVRAAMIALIVAEIAYFAFRIETVSTEDAHAYSATLMEE
ncbi:MAG: YbaN family protein [Eggerthellaceae bacterium]|nr:YbaN family protein [Eggerthellaceae bacterium]